MLEVLSSTDLTHPERRIMSLSNRLVTLLARLRPRPLEEDTSVPPIGRKQVRKRLIEALEPTLMAQGFERFDGGVSRRYRDGWVDVVDIMFPSPNHASTQSPGIDLGRFFTFCPAPLGIGDVTQDNGRPAPHATECHVRKTIYRPTRQQGNPIPNVWYIDRVGHQLQACVDEIARLVHDVMLPWFDWLDDLNMLLDLIRGRKQDIEGKSRDPMLRGTWGYASPFGEEVLAGLLAAQLSDWALCAMLLEPVLARGGVRLKNDRVGTLDTQALEVVRAAHERARAALADQARA
jgi:hypothetical protein